MADYSENIVADEYESEGVSGDRVLEKLIGRTDIGLTAKELAECEAKFNDTSYFNQLVRDAVNDHKKKEELDIIVYVYSARVGRTEAPKHRTTIHAGTQEADITATVYEEYFSEPVKSFADAKDPKTYICKCLSNAAARLYRTNVTLLPVLDHSSSRSRDAFRMALRGEYDQIDIEKLPVRDQEVVKRLEANNRQVVRMDSPIKDSDNSANSGNTVQDAIEDEGAASPFAGIEDDDLIDSIVIDFFGDPVFRVLFRYLYLWKSDEVISHKKRVEAAYDYLSEHLGMDYDDFHDSELDFRRVFEIQKPKIRKYLAASAAA